MLLLEIKMEKDICIFTIVSKNYILYARVFAESLIKFHPDIKIFTLLADKIDGCFDPRNEKFEVVEAEKIGIPDKESFFFKYSILELNTAVKPYFFDYLFKHYKFSKIIYFDPDILITNNLKRIFVKLDKYSIVLTPHITKPLFDEHVPNEVDFLRSGSYNLGFIGLKKNKTTKMFINWWKERVYDKCLNNVEQGFFVDQKWIDLVPSLFQDYYLLREPGYNVAYWNFQERHLFLKENVFDRPKVNGENLYFFHFSGLDPDRPFYISKLQTRFSLSGDLKTLKSLFLTYRDLLNKSGYKDTIKWEYKYGFFDNGVRISEILRKIYLKLSGNKRENFGDPFLTENSSYYRWLTSFNKFRSNVQINNLFWGIYQSREDLKAAFPDILNRDKYSFLEWITYQGRYEYKLDT